MSSKVSAVMQIGLIGVVCVLFFGIGTAGAQTSDDAAKMFEDAMASFSGGSYREAIGIYDDILEFMPDNFSTLRMKGIAQSNLGMHEDSLKQFYRIYQDDQSNISALLGLGVGFGNLGEYEESKKYFEAARDMDPDSTITQNYLSFVDSVIAKYPYEATEKPKVLTQTGPAIIPDWIRSAAGWWSEGQISDDDHTEATEFLLAKGVIDIPWVKQGQYAGADIPQQLRDDAGLWSQRQIGNSDYASGLVYMIKNGIIQADISADPEKIEAQKKAEFVGFKEYLKRITKNISDEKRYIEYPNPSKDVIKKFLRDYIKWNFEEEVKTASEKFPNPTYKEDGDMYVVFYKVFINEQPSGLPLDHVGTLKNSFAFWEEQEFMVNDKKSRVEFIITNKKHEANVWVTWVVRDLGDGVLGHAHLGKGVVEVTLGDYSCDGSFQLYDVASVEYIMTHELGHSVGLPHTTDQNSIMYPSVSPNYAYCLLG